MHSADIKREMFGGAKGDHPYAGEILAEIEADLARLDAGDVSGVPPWLTAEETRTDLLAQKERVENYIADKGV